MVVPLHVQDCARDVIILVQVLVQEIALTVMDVLAVAQAVQEDVGVAVDSVVDIVVDGKDCNL